MWYNFGLSLPVRWIFTTIFMNIKQLQTKTIFAFKYDYNDKGLVAVSSGVTETVQGVRLPRGL